MSPLIQKDARNVAGHSQPLRLSPDDPVAMEHHISDNLNKEMARIVPLLPPARQRGKATSAGQSGNATSAGQSGNAVLPGQKRKAAPPGQKRNLTHTRESNPGYSQTGGINTPGPQPRQSNNGRSTESDARTQNSSSPSTNSTPAPAQNTQGIIHFIGDPATIKEVDPIEMCGYLRSKGLESIVAVHMNTYRPDEFKVVARSPLEAQMLRNSKAVFQSAIDCRITMQPENFYFYASKITKDRLYGTAYRTGLNTRIFDDISALIEMLRIETGLNFVSVKWKEGLLIFCLNDLQQAQLAVAGGVFTLFGITTTFM
uniref:WGS project CBME000000000 data, contig CS3487_c001488 n=1 Tax=Fusarium pseudograminearum CS3487 TaxID=1318458 RepID=A0A096PEG3_FUSPS|nr:unnamed protein product [Fusarium pseudograminearum CS3487]